MTVGKTNFYNEDTKEKFLKVVESESTSRSFRSTFKKLKETEEKIGSDLYEMSLKEIEIAMKPYADKAESTQVLKLRLFESYIDWSIEQGLTEHNLNPVADLDKKEWIKKISN